MDPEATLELINAAHNQSYTLNTTLTADRDKGAYRIVAADGATAVLKTNRNPAWVRQVQRAKLATNHLRSLGYPVPNYSLIDSTDSGTYSLQSELPGGKAEAPTPEQLEALLKVIDLQTDQAFPEIESQDWSWYVMDTLFGGDSANVRSLMQFSSETSALAFELKGATAGLQGTTLRKTDLVHGDMNLGQVLFQGSAVAGILDWDQVGIGDRTIDLAGLWYSVINQPAARDQVMQHLLQVASPSVATICIVHRLLLSVAWNINQAGGDVPAAVADARTGLSLLRQFGA